MGIYKRLKAGVGLAALLCLGSAHAGVFSQNPDPASVPQGGSVVLQFRFAGDGATEDAQLDLQYNGTEFTVTAPTVLVPGSTCVVLTAPARLRIVPPSGAGTPLTSTVTAYCSFNFTAGAATPFGNYDFVSLTPATTTPGPPECVAPAGNQPCSFTPPGRISVVNITSPSVTYNPTFGAVGGPAEVTFPAGGTGTTQTTPITFDGTGGTPGENTVVGPCSISGTGGITINPPFTNVTIPAGDPPADVDGTITLSCTYSAAVQNNLLTCTEDPSQGAPVSRTWDVTCPQGGSTPPTIAYNPATGTQINFQGALATVVNQNIAVNRTSNGQAGASITVQNCAIAPANAAWGAVTGTPIVFPGGSGTPASGTIGLSCTIPAATVTGTLTCDEVANTGVGSSTTPRSWPLQCLAPSPQFSSNPVPNTLITLQGLPGSTVNRTIAVTNTGFAPLTVGPCTITGPDAVNFTTPVVTGSPIAPQGAGSIAFACTAPAAQGSTFSATLTCPTNDPTQQTVSWPLACTSVILSIPTMGLWGKLALGLGVLALGLFGFAMRRRFQ